MPETIVVFDLETVPDYAALARLHKFDEGDRAAAKAALGDKFPKCLWHRIVCIGTLVAQRSNEAWQVVAIDASHIGLRTEPQLILDFANMIAELRRPRLVTFNGNGFDLPVIRYRAMLNRVSAPSLCSRPYFHRYTDDAVDLCDVLSSFGSNVKTNLQEICRSFGLPGKTDGQDGSGVERLVDAGRFDELAKYCCGDVINTYRVWLTYELFCGRLTPGGYAQSDAAEPKPASMSSQ
jgi:predicted PolB exonuclease-like 3'-5' exonuclease